MVAVLFYHHQPLVQVIEHRTVVTRLSSKESHLQNG